MNPYEGDTYQPSKSSNIIRSDTGILNGSVNHWKVIEVILADFLGHWRYEIRDTTNQTAHFQFIQHRSWRLQAKMLWQHHPSWMCAGLRTGKFSKVRPVGYTWVPHIPKRSIQNKAPLKCQHKIIDLNFSDVKFDDRTTPRTHSLWQTNIAIENGPVVKSCIFTH